MLSEKFAAARTQRRREYLMCRPTFFDVVYRINPWMNPAKPVDTALAILQWESLRDLYRELGHTVHEVTAIPGLPDMVYAANGATVIDGRVLGARFRNQERQAEALHFFEWFRVNGFETMREPQFVNEGEGDLVFTGSMILAGHGFRSDPLSHREASEFFDRSVVGLELVDPRFYHLDTALAVLSDNEIMYHPEAFTTESRSWLETHFPDALRVGVEDADVFGLNATSDGLHVLLPESAGRLAEQLAARGFTPIGVDLSELLKGGGSVKCCTLELRRAGTEASSWT